jgi:hypothetical protein
MRGLLAPSHGAVRRWRGDLLALRPMSARPCGPSWLQREGPAEGAARGSAARRPLPVRLARTETDFRVLAARVPGPGEPESEFGGSQSPELEGGEADGQTEARPGGRTAAPGELEPERSPGSRGT